MSAEFKPFRIKDIFTIKKVYGKPISSYVQGEIPYVTGAENNNGVVGYVTAAQTDISKGNCISVDPIRGAACYQANDFVGRGFSGASVNLLYNASLTERNALYACAAIEKAAAPIAAYTNLFNSNRLADATIILPVKHALVPDWDTLCSVVEGGGCDMSNINTSNWKGFKLGELFDIENTWVYGKNKDYKTRSDKKSEKAVAVVSGITVNNGINYFTEDTVSDTEIYKDCLTITTRGEYSGTVFYHDYPFVLANNILVMPMPNINKNAKLFLATILQALPFGGYNNYPTKDKLKDVIVKLPATTEDVPDWAYMEERISELEQERIGELEQERIGELDGYLKATGLNDYVLTDEDKRVLSEVRTVGEFRIGNIFKPLKVGYIGKDKKIGSAKKEPNAEYCIPLTCAKMGNNGIMYYGKRGDFITYKNAISIIADGAISAGMVYAQPEEAGAYSHSYFIKLKDREMTTGMSLYLAEVLRKKLYPIYSREHSPRWDNRVENEIILLPLKPNTTDEIDYDYMERYIKAMEKLVIADVVRYKDKVIETTKRIVNTKS